MLTSVQLHVDLAKVSKKKKKKKKLVELKCINLVQQVALQLEFWLPPDDQLLLLWFSSKWSEWLTTAETPFAINGESRSLIFAENKGTVIPLGLHCGSDSTTSYLLSLQSIYKSISDLLDADFFFFFLWTGRVWVWHSLDDWVSERCVSTNNCHGHLIRPHSNRDKRCARAKKKTN